MKYDILIWAYRSHIYASFHDKFCDIQYLCIFMRCKLSVKHEWLNFDCIHCRWISL